MRDTIDAILQGLYIYKRKLIIHIQVCENSLSLNSVYILLNLLSINVITVEYKSK